MQQRMIVCIMLMLCAAVRLNAQDSYDARVKRYIEQYANWAIAEQQRSGVPAAITLAQGIHETSAGGSELATNANNHFGIKCRREWQGETYAYTDDAPNECFRKYPSALQSYKDHSDYLTGSKRYEALFRLSINDYKGWAHGLKRCGYATNPKYAHLLIKIVENYNLQEYTYAAVNDSRKPVMEAALIASAEVVPEQDMTPPPPPKLQPAVKANPIAATPPAAKRSGMSVSYASERVEEEPAPTVVAAEGNEKPEYGKLTEVNGLKAFYAQKGAVLLDDAFKYKIRYAKLLEFNELPDLPLEADMYIYLEKKNPKGSTATRRVKEGETLAQIAQAEGMQLRYLKYYNRIGANEEPIAGSVLQLQQYAEVKPQTYVKSVAPREEEAPVFAANEPVPAKQPVVPKQDSYIAKKELQNQGEQRDFVAAHDNIQKEAIPVGGKAEQEEKPQPPVVSATPPVQVESPAVVPAVETPAPVMTEPVVAVLPAPTAKENAIVPPSEVAIPVQKETKEEIEYTAVLPEQKVEEPALPKAEIINTVPAAKSELTPVATSRVAVSVPEKVAVPQIPDEPKDEFERLKQKLDRVVYAGAATPVVGTAVEKKSSTQQPEKANDGQKVALAANAAEGTKVHTVKKGDTAFSIAKRYNITMRQLMDWNQLDFDKVKEGQVLRVKP